MTDEKIRTPQQLILSRLAELALPTAARALSKSLGGKPGKDTLARILGGSLESSTRTFMSIATRLAIDPAEMETSLAWNKLSSDAKKMMSQCLAGSVPSSRSTRIREELNACLEWSHFKQFGLTTAPGITQLSGRTPLLFLFPEEFASLSSFEETLIDRPERQSGAGLVVVVASEGWQDEAVADFVALANDLFDKHLRQEDLGAAFRASMPSLATCSEQELFSLLFDDFLNPDSYMDLIHQDPGGVTRRATRPFASLRLRLADGTRHDAREFLRDWVGARGKHDVLVLEGSYGTGKTTLLQFLAYDLIMSWVSERKQGSKSAPVEVSANWPGVVPIFAAVPQWLRRKPKEPLQEFLVSHVFSRAEYRFGRTGMVSAMPFDVFSLMAQRCKDRFVFLVDGLDEAVRTPLDLKRVMEGIGALRGASQKVILTTRPEVFQSQKQAREHLEKEGILRAELELLSADEADRYIDEVLNAFPSSKRIVRKLQAYPDAKQVFCHPLFLHFCCKAAESDVNNLRQVVKETEPYRLFEFFVNQWLGREADRQHPMVGDVIQFMEELAMEVTLRKENKISEQYMPVFIASGLNEIRQIISGDIPLREAADARTCSFMTIEHPLNKNREYSFRLRPFGSYFLGHRIAGELRSERFSPRISSLGRLRMSDSDREMIASAIRSQMATKTALENLTSCILATGQSDFCRHWKFRHLGGNAAALYAELNRADSGEPFLDLDLTAVSLAGLRLFNARIAGHWRAVDLSEAEITDCDTSELTGSEVYCGHAMIQDHSWGEDLPTRGTGTPGGLVELPACELSVPWSEIPVPHGWAWIPPGQFLFGEMKARISVHGFYLKKTEVSKGNYVEFLKSNGEWSKEREAEVYQRLETETLDVGSNYHYLYNIDRLVDDEAIVYLPRAAMIAYCAYEAGRLPSEVEWEYAARSGAGESRMENSSRVHSQDIGKRRRVGDGSPDSLGLFGIQGGVREMCADCYWRDLAVALQFCWDDTLNPFFRPMKVGEGTLATAIHRGIGVARGTSDENPEGDPILGRHASSLGNFEPDIGFRPVLDVHVGLGRVLNLQASVHTRR